MTKQQLAQKRNYFKFMLSGMIKPVDSSVLTLFEIGRYNTIKEAVKDLIDEFENNSRLVGLRVPEYRCWCGKEGKYNLPDYIPEYLKHRCVKVCLKHRCVKVRKSL